MDVVDRLHQRLEEAVARDRPLDGLTVGDLYQQLIPYRAVRTELGLLELAPYEHALLRLLSGERGYLRLEDDDARDEIARELAAPNPILGIYRDYAGVRVTLGPSDAAPLVTPVPPPSSAPPAPPAKAPPAPEPPVERLISAPPEPPVPARPLACRSCHSPLPTDAEVRFCPTCGVDQTLTPCAGCGMPLRAEWNFCIRCGRERGGHPAPRGA
jgi:hypothetical protein